MSLIYKVAGERGIKFSLVSASVLMLGIGLALHGAVGYERYLWVRTGATPEGGMLMALDPASGAVLRTVPTGYSPDFALAPDGSRLYIGSGDALHDSLAIVDTSSGAIVKTVPNPDRPKWGGPAPTSLMVASVDGGHLYMMKRRTTNGRDSTWIAAFDTAKNMFEPQTIPIGDCPAPGLQVRSAHQLEMVCGGENTVYAIHLGAAGEMSDVSVLNLPKPAGVLPNGVKNAEGDVMVPIWGHGDDLFLVKFQGTVVKVNTARMEIVAHGKPADGLLFRGEGTISPDGRLLFAGCGTKATGSDLREQLAVFDAQTLQLVRTIPTRRPFRSVVANPFSRELVMVASDGLALATIDPVSLQEGRVTRLSAMPALIRFPGGR